ncbi:unnamed protein product [Closterium sp. NIES-53]
MAIRGTFLLVLLSVSVLAALTLTTTASTLRGGIPAEDGIPTATTIRTTGPSTSAARTKSVASRRSLGASPKATDKKSVKKACVDGAKKCWKWAASKVTKKDVAKMMANKAIPGSGIAINAAEGVSAARNGDKEGAKKAFVNVAKGLGSVAVGAAAGPHGALAFSAGAAAVEHGKSHVEKALAKRKAEQKEKRDAKKPKRE